MTLKPIHVIAALAFVSLGYLIAYSSPMEATFSPQAVKLAHALHKVTTEKAHSDSQLVLYHLKLASRDSALSKLDARQEVSTHLTASLSQANRRLADSLARLHPELAPVLGQLSQGIQHQADACSSALQDCQSVKDSLRAQIVERDSIVKQRGTLLDSTASIAKAAVTADSAAERQVSRDKRTLLATRVLAVLAIVGSFVIK